MSDSIFIYENRLKPEEKSTEEVVVPIVEEVIASNEREVAILEEESISERSDTAESEPVPLPEIEDVIIPGDVPIPVIAFSYNTTRTDCLYICSDGRIFQAVSDEAFHMATSEEFIRKIQEHDYEDILAYMGKTDEKQVQEMYNLFVEVVLDDNYVLFDDPEDMEYIMPDVEIRGKYWYGFYENKDNIELTTIYKIAGRDKICSDERAYIILDWMYEVLSEYTDKIVNPEKKSAKDSILKKSKEGEVVFDKEYHVFYMKNQLYVFAESGTRKSVMKKAAKKIGAKIVEYDGSMDTYRLELKEDKTYDELEELAEEMESLPFVEAAYVNHIDYGHVIP